MKIFKRKTKSERKLVAQMQEMQNAIDRLAASEKEPMQAYPDTRSRTAESLKGHTRTLEEQLLSQNQELMKQNSQMMMQLSELTEDNSEEEDEEEIMPIEVGSFELKQGPVTWKVSGYSSIEPDPDFNYFPGITFGPIPLDGNKFAYNFAKDRVISVIVPCYNEGGSDLQRTIRSLYRQRLPPGWRIEVVIVMDGADHMDPSMAEYLANMFGVEINSDDQEKDPFTCLPDAETIIVEALDEANAQQRIPAVEGTIGGYSLVVKRHNHRKANSQMWWLGPHSACLEVKYSLATDCGTVFARTATIRLIRRLEAESNLHAVTGFQRIMTSEMQGDGHWEQCNSPFNFMLRMVQRFEFEVDHVSFKGVYDTLGCLHVIPGPCGLFRYSAMGTLKEGLMHDYFRLFQQSSQNLIVGNVELVEDRIPGTLLSFPLKNDKEKPVMPAEGWPRTGFVNEATFYVEAEKPLSQLVKQRRRWLNGTFALYLWMLAEGIVSRSNQDPTNKFLAWILIVVSVLQGLVIRLSGPALLIVWMFRFGLFLPDLFTDPKAIFDPDLSLTYLEIEQNRLPYGIFFGGAYFLLYIVFILGHTPRAKPVENVRYTEPTAYRNDKKSAYRGWLFKPVLWVNALVSLLYIINTIGIIATLGWNGTPIVVRILICVCFTPFIMGFLEGIARRDFRCLWGMLYSLPAALPLMIWFTVWLPAYATTRLSDLTWGNREGKSLDESEKALRRAENGRKVANFLILCNTSVAVIVICLMQVYGSTFPIFVISYTAVLSITFLISFGDLVGRVLSCQHCYNTTSEDPFIEEAEEETNDCLCNDPEAYDFMDDGGVKQGIVTPPESESDTDGEGDHDESYVKMGDNGIVKEENKLV